MSDTWSVFTPSDLFLGLLGAVGFMSVVVVIATASNKVNTRESILSESRRLQNLEPEENVMNDIESEQKLIDDKLNYDTYSK